jgi:hypothetical protein
MNVTLARIADWVLLYLRGWARPFWELPSFYWLPGTALTSLINRLRSLLDRRAQQQLHQQR